jgi:hypothetical protein
VSNSNTLGIYPSLLILALASVLTGAQEPEAIHREYQRTLDAWRKEVAAAAAAAPFSSDLPDTPSYWEIVSMGPPVLPLIVGTLEASNTIEDLRIGKAFAAITEKRAFCNLATAEVLSGDAAGTAEWRAKRYIAWWHAGCPTDARSVRVAYHAWKCLEAQGHPYAGEAKVAWVDAVRTGGRAVIELLMENVRDGDMSVLPELVLMTTPDYVVTESPQVAQLRQRAAPENATREEVLEWWEREKDFFTLPRVTYIGEETPAAALADEGTTTTE